MSKTPFTLTFEGTVATQYYAYMNNYDGYGGFNFLDVVVWGRDCLYDQKATVDSGYRSALHGQTEVWTYPVDNTFNGYGVGSFYSESTETFSLKSGIFASAWETNQPVQFISYTGSNGTYVQKASVTVKLSQAAVKLNFANYGSDFKNISKFTLISTLGSAGVYNSYYHAVTYGYEIAIDNVKVVWNGPVPHTTLHHGAHHHAVHQAVHHVAALGHPASHQSGGAHDDGSNAHAPPAGVSQAYHSELASLASAYGHSGSLTEQFDLPHVSHGLLGF